MAINLGNFETGFERSLRLGREEWKKRRAPITRLAELAKEKATATGVTIEDARRTILRENLDLRRQVQKALNGD